MSADANGAKIFNLSFASAPFPAPGIANYPELVLVDSIVFSVAYWLQGIVAGSTFYNNTGTQNAAFVILGQAVLRLVASNSFRCMLSEICRGTKLNQLVSVRQDKYPIFVPAGLPISLYASNAGGGDALTAVISLQLRRAA